MSREIKYRAWSKKLNGFLDITGFECFKGKIYGIFHDGDYIGYNKEDIVLMQYTGLKDKNGKEIYEGDILAKEEFLYIVKCELPEFYLKPIDKWSLKNNIQSISMNRYSGINKEVVGNIYTDSELLDK